MSAKSSFYDDELLFVDIDRMTSLAHYTQVRPSPLPFFSRIILVACREIREITRIGGDRNPWLFSSASVRNSFCEATRNFEFLCDRPLMFL